jgi:peptidoglycan/xylan/chitin deacetylase (PgdA/CDA1 family)
MKLTQRLSGRIASSILVNPAIRLDEGPICCFTFDDCPLSALENGGGMLEAAGGAGTFFISTMLGTSQSDAPMMWGGDLQNAISRGHEIGCHTYSHVHMPQLSAEEIRVELIKNAESIRSALPDISLASFAYPFGEVSLCAKRIVAKRFAVARGLRYGSNGKVVDLSELRTIGINSRYFDRDRLRSEVKRAAAERKWIVFTTHDVTEQPSPWGCKPSEFQFVVDQVRSLGFEILTLKGALGRITHRPS